jgi:hypothetical protein
MLLPIRAAQPLARLLGRVALGGRVVLDAVVGGVLFTSSEEPTDREASPPAALSRWENEGGSGLAHPGLAAESPPSPRQRDPGSWPSDRS